MFYQRPMTRFAVDMRMHAALLHRLDVGMTSLASLVSGKVERMRCNLGDGCSAVVPILSKAMGDVESAYSQKYQCAGCIKRNQAEKMS